MKLVQFYWDHPVLKPYCRTVPAGSYLFRQGESGNTMVLVVQGLVQLLSERDGEEFLVNFVEAGQFLGEKAIVLDTPFQRAFTAQAKTDVILIEFDLDRIDTIKAAAPELMTDILKQMFQVAAARLDRSNFLIHSLRSPDPVERLTKLIIYFAQSFGRATPQGTEFWLTPSSLRYYLDFQSAQLKEFIELLVNLKLLQMKSESCYVLRNENALIAAIPELSQRFRDGSFDNLSIAS